jgi:hypothetical protein
MSLDPTASEDELNVACPPDIVTAGEDTPSMLNVTVPVAVLGDTEAVNVTDWPNVDGLDDEESVIAAGI